MLQCRVGGSACYSAGWVGVRVTVQGGWECILQCRVGGSACYSAGWVGVRVTVQAGWRGVSLWLVSLWFVSLAGHLFSDN